MLKVTYIYYSLSRAERRKLVEDVAEVSGMKESSVRQMFYGEFIPKYEMVKQAIADCLGYPDHTELFREVNV